MTTDESSIPRDATGVDRREFLRLSSAVAAAGALASTACQVPPEAAVPFHDMPETMVDGVGQARVFHTVLDGAPVRVRTREGRPILVSAAPNDPSRRGLTVRHHAALMDLYDPDRARGPVAVRRRPETAVPTSWTPVSAEVVAALQRARDRAALVTGPVDSPAVAAAIEGLRAQTGLRHVVWTPLPTDPAMTAERDAFGSVTRTRARLDLADVIVGLGAEFLDRPADGLERDFAARRTPEGTGATRMNRFVQFEGRLTLTGANADRRIRVRDSRLALVGAALAHELIVAQAIGRLASDASVRDALAPYAIDAVAAAAGVEAGVLRSVAAELARAAGRAVVLAGGSASTSSFGPALELSDLLVNLTLGAYDAGVLEGLAESPLETTPSPSALAGLVDDMAAGRIDLLIVAGVNPVYDAPAGLGVAAALAKVATVVSLNDRVDETSRLADYLAPTSHPFECWGDAALPRGIFAVQQPVSQPLFDTRGLLDVLVDWAAAVGDARAGAALAAATSPVPVPPATTAERARSTSLAYYYVRQAWAERLGLDPISPVFENAWTGALRTGWWQGPAPAAASPTLTPATLSRLAGLATAAPPLELQLYPHHALGTGRGGNNGWLHELPDPITRLTWGGAVSIAPRRFDEMGLANGDLVEVDAGHATLVAPAYRHAGMHQDVVALPLGLGRRACGPIGELVGPNAFGLARLDGPRVLAAGLPVTIRRVDGREALAMAQGSDVIDRARRPLVPTTTLTAFEANPAAGTEQTEGGASAWPDHAYPNARWAMAIDLTKCIGCGKCVVGCQAENNIPIVGRRGMLDGREMSWLRIDRYYDAPAKDGGWDAEVWDGPLEVVEEPQTLFEPMLCQHCENAPCETVCPFAATVHSEDGLNQQIYNRCVGTRYCANNCPFKVRRFNYWELSKRQDSSFFRWLVPRIAKNAELNTREPMQLKNNPEVTVRSRGVMEKCSFCVQRIRAARAEATRAGAPKDHLPDGAVVPACMEACPTSAITFGDINAPGSRVSAWASSPRAMRLLEAVGVKPSISYLTKVRNDKV